ncbi:hypothetical protein ACDX78_07980 [Virgibacillus oceani]
MKPIDGEMMVNDVYEVRNFHDEKEWRFIPEFNTVDTELPMVIDKLLLKTHIRQVKK